MHTKLQSETKDQNLVYVHKASNHPKSMLKSTPWHLIYDTLPYTKRTKWGTVFFYEG